MFINLYAVARILGPTIYALAILALIPTAYSLSTGTDGAISFIIMAVTSLATGLILCLIGKHPKAKNLNVITIRELFLFTTSMWAIIVIYSALPFYLELEDITFPAAIFESASGLSTTGATVINHLDNRPPAVLLWRSMLQLLGGIGFVMIAVAVLPQVAMGGMNIFKTESTSFENSAKFTPHAKTMALALLAFYLAALSCCTITYMIGGLDFFLAINAACCTVSTGGMMPIDSSMNGLSPIVHYSATFFMFIMSCPLLIILGAISGNFKRLWTDQQIRGYGAFIIIVATSIAISLIIKNNYDVETAFRVSFFNVISILSSSGFSLDDFTAWNPLATILFMILLPMGGCSGSTAGGMKFFRLQICASLFKTQMIKSIHPHRVIRPRFNGNPLDEQTICAIISFLVAYISLALASSIAGTVMGLDVYDSISATLSSLSNIGQVMGPTINPSSNYSGLNAGLYILFSFDMMVGRLEIIPVFLCLTRIFWRA